MKRLILISLFLALEATLMVFVPYTALSQLKGYTTIGPFPTPTPTATATATATPTATPTATVANTLLTNLYAYYQMNGNSGTSATDSSVNARTLVQFGTGTVGSDPAGILSKARSWDGSGNVSLHDSTVGNFQPGSNHFSFSVWVNFGTTGLTGNDTGILSKAQAGVSYEWICWLTPGDNKIHMLLSNDGTTQTAVVWPTAISRGTWYHVCGGWDGVHVWLTVNAGTRVTANFSGPIATTTNGFDVGFEQGSAGNFSGKIDELGIWMSRDLTDPEISYLYNGGGARPFTAFQ